MVAGFDDFVDVNVECRPATSYDLSIFDFPESEDDEPAKPQKPLRRQLNFEEDCKCKWARHLKVLTLD